MPIIRALHCMSICLKFYSQITRKDYPSPRIHALRCAPFVPLRIVNGVNDGHRTILART